MAVSFCIGKTMEEAATKGPFVDFDEKVQTFLCKTSERTRPKADLLLALDAYGDKTFDKKEIKEVIKACELLVEEYEEAEIKKFANELKLFCEGAMQNELILFALGD